MKTRISYNKKSIYRALLTLLTLIFLPMVIIGLESEDNNTHEIFDKIDLNEFPVANAFLRSSINTQVRVADGDQTRPTPQDIKKAREQIVHAEEQIAKLREKLKIVEQRRTIPATQRVEKLTKIGNKIKEHEKTIKGHSHAVNQYLATGSMPTVAQQAVQAQEIERQQQAVDARVQQKITGIPDSKNSEIKKDETNVVKQEQMAQMQKQAQAAAAAKAAGYGVHFSGYVRNDLYYDTRQVAGFREDIISLFPRPALLDECCNDINARGQYHLYPIQTHFKWAARGPEVLRAKSVALIEADFTGAWLIDNRSEQRILQEASTINGLYLTDALFKLDWERTSLIVGQTFHPFIEERATAGLLMTEPLARSPQIRVTHKVHDRLEAIFAIIDQVDFKNWGPPLLGVGEYSPSNSTMITPFTAHSTQFTRSSLMPEFHFHIKPYWKEHVFGIAASVKRLQPRLSVFSTEISSTIFEKDPVTCEIIIDPVTKRPIVSPATAGVAAQLANGKKVYKTDQAFIVVAAMAYAGLQFKRTGIKAKISYGEALDDQYTLGGYGVSSFDKTTGYEKYTPLRTMLFFGEIFYKHKTVQPSLQFGYSKALGGKCDLYNFTQLGEQEIKNRIPADLRFLSKSNFLVFGLAPMIDYIAKIYPNIKVIKKPLVFTGGIEFCRAAYGTINCHGEVDCTQPVNNVRAIVSALYFF